MERAGVFIDPRIGIDAVIETDRADGQFITQPYAHRIAHVVETWFFRCREQIARVREQRALQFAENWKGVLDIKDGEKFTSDWMTFWVMWTEIPITKASHGVASPNEKTLIDGNCGRFCRTAHRQ
jgi:hypothetical protein